MKLPVDVTVTPAKPVTLAHPLTVRSLEGNGKTTIPAGTVGYADRLFWLHRDSKPEPRYRVRFEVAGEAIVVALAREDMPSGWCLA